MGLTLCCLCISLKVQFRGAYVYGSCGVLRERKAELPITSCLEWKDGGCVQE